MGIFHDCAEEKTLKEILVVLQQIKIQAADNNALLRVIAAEQIAIKQLLQIIVNNTNPKPITVSVVDRFSGEIPMANGALVFNVGQTSIDTITPLLADGVTPSGGVVSNVVITFSDPSATFVINPDNTVTFTAVAASTAPVSGTRACTITDTDTAVSTWSSSFTVLVNAVVPPAQLTQSVVDVFSTPTP